MTKNCIIPIIVISFSLIFETSFAIVTEISQMQKIDNLGFGKLSEITFQQRVFIDNTYYTGGKKNKNNTPIFVYLGGESSIDDIISGERPGILSLAGSEFGAVLMYIEHRFYGKSVPLGTIQAAMLDTEVRGTLTTRQALEDFANVITSYKRNISALNSPVIVFGGSYSGMLAAWFRLKYPQIAFGALASSAPILISDELPLDNQYCSIVSHDFKDENEMCFDRISRSWKLIDNIASGQHGLENLSRLFKTCGPLDSASDLKTFLVGVYNNAAQYNGAGDGLISHMCDKIIEASEDDILGGISRAVSLVSDSQICYNLTMMVRGMNFQLDQASTIAWTWQSCTELMPHDGGCSRNTMFEKTSYNQSEFMERCYLYYGVHPHANDISNYYGGVDLRFALKNFGSNIIFSNGLKDPYSGASILEDISSSIVAITTTQGSHCLDINSITKDDPKWLKNQRKQEIKIMAKWIEEAQAKNSRSELTNWTSWSKLMLLIILNFLIVG